MAYSTAIQRAVMSNLDFEISSLRECGYDTKQEELTRALIARYFLGQIDEKDLPPVARDVIHFNDNKRI